MHGAVTPEEYFDSSPLGLAVFGRLAEFLAASYSEVTARASTSQVAFRRRRGFAYLWRPAQYLRGPAAEVVLSIALHDALSSPRFKEIAHPARDVWMHHLEIRSVAEVDAEVEQWLLIAADEAA